LKKGLLIVLFVRFGLLPLMAQNIPFTHYQVEAGLSNNTVLCSVKDKNGFMWFGTKDGLNRFDGYVFKTFRNDPADTNSIGNDIIYSLYQDRSGSLLVGTDRGIYQYNALTESFSPLKTGTQNQIRAIKADRAGNLWFISDMILYKYDQHKQQGYAIKQAGTNNISLEFVNNSLWISTTDRIIKKYNPQNNSFTSYDVFGHSSPATSYWIQKINDAGNGKLLVGTSNQGIKLFDTFQGTYKDLITYNSDKTEIFARDFMRFSNTEYWLGTESGIYIYNIATEKATLLQKQYNNPYSLSDNAIYTICKDEEGGVWVGTYFGGLNYYPRQYTPFEKFFPTTGENSLSGNAVRELCADNYGNLWIGTEDAGLNKYNTATGKYVNYKPLGHDYNISSGNIHGLLAVGNRLLIGTFEHGLDVMDINTGKVFLHHTVFKDQVLKSNFFYTLYKTRNEKVITATSNGLYYYNVKNQTFQQVTQVPLYVFYTSILEDNEGKIWVGSFREGLFCFDPKRPDLKTTRSLKNSRINRIFEDHKHQIWIATENGLYQFKSNNSFVKYTTKNGLPSNVINAMLEDNRGTLWITTSKGLVSMNSHKQLKVYTQANGLLSDQFNYNSAYKDNNGNMYMGCVKGLIKFNPDKFINNSYQPHVYLTAMELNNHELDINGKSSVLEKSVTFTDTVHLNYSQSSFSLNFAALAYTSPQTTAYAYKMEGLDKDWIFIPSNRKVYFTRLSPGTYVFKVKASNNSGLWSKQTAKLTVIILPPLWASGYAWVVYILALAALVSYLVRNYHKTIDIRNLRKFELLENEKANEIYQAKIAFFTHVAHEIRTPLTLIKGPMEKVMRKAALITDVNKQLNIMDRNVDRLLTLTNQLLDFRKTETDGFSLNFVKTNITLLIQECQLRFAPAIEKKGLSFELAVSKVHLYAYVDVEAINKVLSNLMDNAIKYASVSVKIELIQPIDEKTFTLLISNDGYLIPYTMKEKIFETFFRMQEAEGESGTGIGLPLSRYLTELHKGTLTLLPTQEEMNIFALTLPIHQDIEFNI
jgi:ligand-binding sensor domain-containing protein/signal transduction histidine kinase